MRRMGNPRHPLKANAKSLPGPAELEKRTRETRRRDCESLVAAVSHQRRQRVFAGEDGVSTLRLEP
jgi:hypothetical protein